VLTPGGRRRYPVEAVLRLLDQLTQGARAPQRRKRSLR